MIAIYQNAVFSLTSMRFASHDSSEMMGLNNSLREAGEHLSENNQWLQAAQDKLQELYDINTNTADVFRTASELQTSLARAIAQVRGGWKTNGFDCSLVKQGWFRELKVKSAYSDAVQQGIVKVDKEGNITYQWDMVEKLLAMDTEDVSVAQYRALIQAYDSILVSEIDEKKKRENLEKFLNAAYVTKKFQEPKKPTSGNMMNAYAYFNQQSMALTDYYYVTSLGPVFKEMAKYYINHIVTEDMLKDLYYGNLSLDAQDLIKKKLFGAGILSDIVNYGDISFTTMEGQEPRKPITISKLVTGEQEQCLLSVKTSNLSKATKIQQFGYGDGFENIANGGKIANSYLEGLKKSLLDVAGEEAAGYVSSKALEKLGLIVPGGAVAIEAVSFLVAIGEANEQNKEIDDTQRALNLTNYANAVGIKGQIQVVDGKMSYQYLNLDKKQLAINLGAYNQEIRKSVGKKELSVSDLIDADNIKELAEFCNGGQDKIQEYRNGLKGEDPTTIFTDADREALADVAEVVVQR